MGVSDRATRSSSRRTYLLLPLQLLHRGLLGGPSSKSPTTSFRARHPGCHDGTDEKPGKRHVDTSEIGEGGCCKSVDVELELMCVIPVVVGALVILSLTLPAASADAEMQRTPAVPKRRTVGNRHDIWSMLRTS